MGAARLFPIRRRTLIICHTLFNSIMMVLPSSYLKGVRLSQLSERASRCTVLYCLYCTVLSDTPYTLEYCRLKFYVCRTRAYMPRAELLRSPRFDALLLSTVVSHSSLCRLKFYVCRMQQAEFLHSPRVDALNIDSEYAHYSSISLVASRSLALPYYCAILYVCLSTSPSPPQITEYGYQRDPVAVRTMMGATERVLRKCRAIRQVRAPAENGGTKSSVSQSSTSCDRETNCFCSFAQPDRVLLVRTVGIIFIVHSFLYSFISYHGL